ncbi:hypothetical protein [Kitasatospora sp. NPDC094015]|uniref:hypothetical protein n=1 Tax=Kitasatospora sp. NPDC094015 TaxID=3155205 RepID=UPI0033224B24
MNEQHTVPQAGRRLIGLYPARYRELYGEDIAATFAEATEGLTGRALLRERLDLASHALRLRLRIASTDPAGRILAGAAPIALALGVGESLYDQAWYVEDVIRAVSRVATRPALAAGTLGAYAALVVPWIVALLCAAAGRWKPARRAAVLGLLAETAFWELILGHTWQMYGEFARIALLAALVLLAPADLVDTGRRGRWEVTGLAIGAGLPLAALAASDATVLGVFWQSVPALLPIWAFAVAAALLLAHLSARRPDLFRAAGIALGTVPWLLEQLPRRVPTVWAATAFVVLIGGAVALGGIIRLLRRAIDTEPAEPA